ncbi:hypothetical protein GCM10011588_63710 [Nocardia jinanensis]|uniref:Uncharacterized protein n=1 Tax=Nocardia jinanensis TaxID=382504 RepID=A0A917RXC4_9NOCA|nr:hypothetical protein GCM10011588_63710 [Nocardia jinanensis]
MLGVDPGAAATHGAEPIERQCEREHGTATDRARRRGDPLRRDAIGRAEFIAFSPPVPSPISESEPFHRSAIVVVAMQVCVSGLHDSRLLSGIPRNPRYRDRSKFPARRAVG